jgi:NAD(P)-dependent dehydrogenase (short-subunit alcohol dehydrogenase family)
MNICNRVAVVTGGAVRVGRAICHELASGGTQIVCQYHSSEQQAASLKEEITGEGGRIELIQCDLNRASSYPLILKKTLEVFGQVDVLVNNAALFYETPLGTVTEEDWDTFHDLNLKSAFFLSQEISAQMKTQGSGKIINIGDTSAPSPWPSYIPYATSKAGLIAMSIGLAKALAPDIQVNCINPGPVMLPENSTENERSLAIEQTLLKREGSAADIARTVRFLVEDTDYITGAVIPVDGGRGVR